MECMILHNHQVVFSPRNALAEEQAEITYKTLHPIMCAKINKDYSTHIEISWTEEVWIQKTDHTFPHQTMI